MQEKNNGSKKRSFSLLICFIAAFCLWFYVAYVENPDMTKWISGIPITVSGEAKLHEKGLDLYKIENGKIDLKIRAKRNQFKDLDTSTISVTADVSSISEPGKHQISVSISFPSSASSASITDRRNENLIVTVDDYVTKVFTVEPNIISHPQNEYFVYSSVIEDDHMKLSVSGCTSLIEKISRVSTSEIDLTSATENVVYPVSFIAYDEDGNEVSGIDFNTQKSSVTFTIYKSSVIPVEIELIGDSPNVEASCVEQKISIMGPAESVNSITNLTVRVNEYNFSPGETALIALNLPDDVRVTNKSTNEVEIVFNPVETSE